MLRWSVPSPHGVVLQRELSEPRRGSDRTHGLPSLGQVSLDQFELRDRCIRGGGVRNYVFCLHPCWRSVYRPAVGGHFAHINKFSSSCLSLTSYHHVIKRTDYRLKEPRRHRMKMQTLEVGHMNAAKKQSCGPLRRGPIRRGAIRIGPNGSGSSWDGNQ